MALNAHTDGTDAELRSGDPAGEPILDVRDVVHSYDGTLALEHVSLAVRRGEFLTLLGPSGSGKSTLLRIIAGLETPSSVAAMRLGGSDIAHLPANQRNVATVFQHFALFPHMSVGANVEYGLRVRGVAPAERRRRAQEALDMVRLPDKYERRVFQLSGGERQRVALARSLVVAPDILLLDEPLGALDERLRLDMQIELIELHKRTGATFILVTHSQEEALTMSDRIVLMRAGEVEQIGTPKELFERPVSAFAARFMGVENVFQGTLATLQGNLAEVTVGGERIYGTLHPGATLLPGDPAFVAVRADHVRRAPAIENEAKATTVLPGTLQATVYKGKYQDLAYMTPIGPVICRTWNVDAVEDSEGIAWPAARCVVGAIGSD